MTKKVIIFEKYLIFAPSNRKVWFDREVRSHFILFDVNLDNSQ